MSKPKPPGALRRRVLTALFLLALVVGALFYLPSAWLAGFLGVFILVAAWEWAGLCGLSRPGERIPYVVVLAGAGTLALWASGHNTVYAIAIATVAVLWWLWALVDLVRHPQEPSGMFGSVAGKLLGGALVLLPAWLSAIYLHDTDPISPAAVLFVLVLVWVADSSAYFVGRTWGRTKLAPRVSPGKTLEGIAGAAVGVMVLAAVCGTMIWRLQGGALLAWVLMALLVLGFSVVGDLVESKLKRLAKAKDSGSGLPGHGGVLDRIDALTSAVPAFAVGWTSFVDTQA